jgi:hypothetical protein
VVNRVAFYVPLLEKPQGVRKDGSVFAKDPLYVLTAVSLFEKQWFYFERETQIARWPGTSHG